MVVPTGDIFASVVLFPQGAFLKAGLLGTSIFWLLSFCTPFGMSAGAAGLSLVSSCRDHDATLPTPGRMLDGCPASKTHGPAVPWPPSLDPPWDPPGASHPPSFGPPSQGLAVNICEQEFIGYMFAFHGHIPT